MTSLATSRYATFRPSLGVPVRTSLGRPKFPTEYELREEVRGLMPLGLFGKGLGADEFTRRYRERLDMIGVDALRAEFDLISKRNDHRRLVLLCFEDVRADEFCHRRVFARWWTERTGQRVPEVGGGGVVHIDASNERQIVLPFGGSDRVRAPGR